MNEAGLHRRQPSRITLEQAVGLLRTHRAELEQMGVQHAAVFGSLARGDATETSDLDVMVELDENRRLSVFDLAGICLFIEDRARLPVDLSQKRNLHPLIREEVLAEAVYAF
jgi:predicted nucleotidyltransferase